MSSWREELHIEDAKEDTENPKNVSSMPKACSSSDDRVPTSLPTSYPRIPPEGGEKEDTKLEMHHVQLEPRPAVHSGSPPNTHHRAAHPTAQGQLLVHADLRTAYSAATGHWSGN